MKRVMYKKVINELELRLQKVLDVLNIKILESN